MILAISLVVVMQLFSGGLKSSRITSDYLYGIFHAREKVEEILLNKEVTPGIYSGDFGDGYQWEASIQLVESEEDESLKRLPLALFDVAVNVKWQSGRHEKHYETQTAMLAKKAETDGLNNQ